MAEVTPSLPIPISNIGGKYLIFDIDAISWLRRCHNICGVFVGTLPQNPQQNVFMGLPMQIMIEEAQLLLDLGIAYILNDAKAHDMAVAKLNDDNRQKYLSELNDQVAELTAAKARSKEIDKKKALKRIKEKVGKTTQKQDTGDIVEIETTSEDPEAAEALFSASVPATSSTPGGRSSNTSFAITPTSSALMLASEAQGSPAVTLLPHLSSSSYSLYKHLHQSRIFFHTPGLRFGSQFSVYPGDPLRFHSHFLAVGLDWEEEIDLMDIVGGGRLGTGVKKGFLLGGKEPGPLGSTALDSESDSDSGKMRCFSIEWAVM